MTARPSSLLVYLASASPRRRELLAQIGVGCELLPVAVDENPKPGEAAPDLVRRLACAKLRAGVKAAPAGRPVVAADTVVTLDGEIFGKPRDRADAARMLTRLAGREHAVLTAVAVAANGREAVELSVSEVSFRAMDAAEIRAYCATGEPDDKAGAYAIQGLGAIFIAAINGSYSGVMGLPLMETAALLRQFGHSVLAPGAPP